MSADKKKSMVKFYLILVSICAIAILTIFIIDTKLIKPDNKFFEYLKSVVFGIFTGAATGLAISFYEYRKQIYSDFYIFIKQTNDCIKST